jgi:hypothetical protein
MPTDSVEDIENRRRAGVPGLYIGGINEQKENELPRPPHPYWCDHCGQNAGFRIPGCEIDHAKGCPRKGENAMKVYQRAVAWCKATGKSIP